MTSWSRDALTISCQGNYDLLRKQTLDKMLGDQTICPA